MYASAWTTGRACFSTTAAKAGTGLSSRTWGKRWARAGCGQGWEGDLRADENFLNLAGPGEYCFAEGQLLAPYREKLESLVLYHWNRRYPADVYFDLDLSQWRLVSRREFPGTSHDTITKEVYLP